MNKEKQCVDTKKLWQIGGGRTLRAQEYHIGIGIQVKINKVFVYAMCINPQKKLQI
jgi:hypothetical protein